MRINDYLAEINGIPAADHLGRTTWDVLPDLADIIEPLHRQVIETGKPILDIEIQGVTKAQPENKRDWIASYHPLKDANGTVLGVNVVVQDITEIKQAQAERAQLLVEAEAANRSKDEFVAMVAHELRSPLNAIMGWAKLLQTRHFPPETINKALATIVRNTQAQVQLVEDLLDVSRMARGTLQLTMGPVNLKEVLETALETISPVAQTKQLQLSVQIHQDISTSGDSYRLQQVILNLLTNAIKFMPEGGRIEVELSTIVYPAFIHQNPPRIVDHLCKTQFAQIQIRDNGKGIHPEFLPHIFERFRQDDQSVTTKQGLGLGLTIVQYLVELHHGIVTAESAGEGQGATFTVFLPVLESQQVETEEQCFQSS